MKRRSFLHHCSLLPLAPFVSGTAVTALAGTLRPKEEFDFCGSEREFELNVGKGISRVLQSEHYAEMFLSSLRCHRESLESRELVMPGVWVHDRRLVPHECQYRICVLGVEVHSGTITTDSPKPDEQASEEFIRQLLRVTDELVSFALEHQSIWHRYREYWNCDLEIESGSAPTRRQLSRAVELDARTSNRSLIDSSSPFGIVTN